MSETVILGVQHENNLGGRVVEYDQPPTVRLRVLLENYEDTYGRTALLARRASWMHSPSRREP